VAITSSEKRGRLEDAFQASAGLSQNPTSLRAYLRKQEQSARASISGGAVKLNIGNGQRVEFFDAGVGQITQTEIVELYRDLIDDFDQAFLFIWNCSSVGLDAFVTEMTLFPNSTKPAAPASIIDSSGRWAQLCTQFGIVPATVIGQPVNDSSVFLWLMFFEVAVTESRSDYSQMRIAEGNQFV
jgi:hypothetical protein